MQSCYLVSTLAGWCCRAHWSTSRCLIPTEEALHRMGCMNIVAYQFYSFLLQFIQTRIDPSSIIIHHVIKFVLSANGCMRALRHNPQILTHLSVSGMIWKGPGYQYCYIKTAAALNGFGCQFDFPESLSHDIQYILVFLLSGISAFCQFMAVLHRWWHFWTWKSCSQCVFTQTLRLYTLFWILFYLDC